MEELSMGDKTDDLQKLNENGHIGATKRIELLLWGDKTLGIRGLKGRVDRIERTMLIMLLMLILITLVTVADLNLAHGSSLLALLVKGLLGGLVP